MWRNFRYKNKQCVQLMGFYCNLCRFVAKSVIHAILSRNFMWRKLEPKSTFVEKKWQIWGLRSSYWSIKWVARVYIWYSREIGICPPVQRAAPLWGVGPSGRWVGGARLLHLFTTYPPSALALMAVGERRKLPPPAFLAHSCAKFLCNLDGEI